MEHEHENKHEYEQLEHKHKHAHEPEQSFVSVVVYVHNNAKHLYVFLETVYNGISALFSKFEFIFVDDGSTDNSAAILAEYMGNRPAHACSVIRMGIFQGLEPSMKAGMDLCIGDFVYGFDTVAVDYSPSIINEAFSAVKEGNDIVVASRLRSGMASKIFYAIFNRFSNLQHALAPMTFSVVSRRAINRMGSMAAFATYRKAQYAACNLNMKRILYSNDKHIDRQTRYRSKERTNTIIDAILLFTSFAFRVSVFLTAVMALFMVFSGIYVVVVYLDSEPVPGWAPIMGLLSVGFFGVFVIFSIVVKYLDLLLRIVSKRQEYLVSSITDFHADFQP